jgi:hypothetical protein
MKGSTLLDSAQTDPGRLDVRANKTHHTQGGGDNWAVYGNIHKESQISRVRERPLGVCTEGCFWGEGCLGVM